MTRAIIAASLLTLSACVQTSPPAAPCPACPSALTAPRAQVACPGAIDAPPGLKPTRDAKLYDEAANQPGAGGICTGQVFEATQPIRVYRVWNKDKPSDKIGRWWTLTPPQGPVDDFRKVYGICAGWGDRNIVTECKLKVGAKIVIGPGQSMLCEYATTEYATTTIPASPTNQVFIPNDTRDPDPAKQIIFVDGCTPGTAWP
jgi:hypothetical protein